MCALFSLTGCYNTEPRENVLKIYNWADYIDEDVLTEFPRWYKEQTGEDIRIVYQTFDINEIMLTKIERGHEDFDVVCPSESVCRGKVYCFPLILFLERLPIIYIMNLLISANNWIN